jgi:cobalt-zinc-cadmium efflux system outer membrane protein
MRHLMPCLAGLSLGALILHAGWACAQSGPPTNLATTLAMALAQASARDPQLTLLQARLAEAQAGIDLAHGPTPGPASVSLNHLSDRLNHNQGHREWEVEVATPIWLPGQQSARLHAAQAALAQRQAQWDERQLALAGDLRQRWWQLAQTQALAQLAQQRVQTARQLEADVQRRYQSGDVARVDLNLARTERLTAEAEALSSQAEQLRAQQAYAALTGSTPPAQLAPENPGTLEPQANDLRQHPQARALNSTRELAASRLALVDASRRDAPEVALRWTSQRNDAFTPYDQAIGVKLTVPLSVSDRVRQDSAAARAELAQADSEQAQAMLHLEQARLQALQDIETATTQLALARQRSELTADNLRLAQRAFELGEQDLATLLRARAANHDAQAWLTRQTLALHAAQSQLRQAQGVLPEAQP